MLTFLHIYPDRDLDLRSNFEIDLNESNTMESEV